MVAAALAFSQPGGGGIGSPGFALIGTSGLAVTASNGNNAGVTDWTYDFIDVPPGSAVPTGVVQSGATPTYSFNPDVAGSYEMKITVSDGSTTASDTRIFVVPESTGQIMPAFGEINGFDNWSGLGANPNSRGWATSVETWLRTLDTPLVTLTAGPVLISQNQAFVEFNGLAGIAATLPPAKPPSGTPVRRLYYFKNKTNVTNTITPAGADTIEGAAAPISLPGSGAFVVLARDGISNWDVVAGESAMTLGGDVTGPPLSSKVVGWENKPLDSATMSAPSDTMVPQYNGILAKWKAVLASAIVAGAVTAGTAGQVYVTNSTPAAAWTSLVSVELTHGRFTAGGTGTDTSVVIGPRVGFEGTLATLYLLPHGVAAGSNFALESDGTNLIYSAIGATGSHSFYNNIAGTLLASIEGTHGRFTAGGTGSEYKVVTGPLFGAETSYAAIYFLPSATGISSTNYGVAGNGTNVYLNAPVGFIFGTAPAVILNDATSNGSLIINLNHAASTSLEFSTTCTPGIFQDAATTDVATQNFTFTSQAPFASAVTHLLAGDFIFNIPASIGVGSKYGGFTVEYAGAPSVRIGPYANNAYAAIWFLDGGTPTSANLGFLGNQSFTYLNAPAGATLVLSNGANSASGISMNFSGGNTWTETAGASIAAWAFVNPNGFIQIAPSATLYTDANNFYMRDSAHNQVVTWGLVYNGSALAQIASTVTQFSINFLAATSDVAPANLVLSGQAPWASATVHTVSGDVVVSIPPGLGGSTKFGGFQIQYGSFSMYIGSYQNGSGGAIWTGVTPNANNFILYGDSSGNTIVNSDVSTGTIYFRAQNTDMVTISAATATMLLDIPILAYSPAVNAQIIHNTATSDVATRNITIQPQAPFATATTNLHSGDLIVFLPPSVGATNNAAYAKWGGFQVQYNGTVVTRLGDWTSFNLGSGNYSNAARGALWFLDAGSPSGTNYAISGTATVTYVNATTSGFLAIGDTTHVYWGANGVDFFGTSPGSDFGSGTGVIHIADATTTPTTNVLSNGGILYSDGGALKWRGTSGTITTMAPAEPHCPRCGLDFAHEWVSPRGVGRNPGHEEHFAVCMPCLIEALHRHGVDPDEYMIHHDLKEAA